jgi:ferredoxin
MGQGREGAATLEGIEEALRPDGLCLRGAFHPEPGDEVPALPEGTAVGTLVLAGNAGPAMWTAFAAAGAVRATENALDEWSREVIGRVAADLGAQPLFPFGGRPWHPFQRWAQRAEPVHPSPIGPLIHPRYGLWHAYRGALAFAARLELPPREERPSPCESCAGKPCLATCPVGAFTTGAYDVPACIEHVASAAGADCATEGCRARRACPVGRDYHYPPEQAAFHMTAFVRANRGA